MRDTINNLSLRQAKRIRLVEQPTTKLPPVAADKRPIRGRHEPARQRHQVQPRPNPLLPSRPRFEADAVQSLGRRSRLRISTGSLDRVWEKFYRVAREAVEGMKSTGLGLSFVRSKSSKTARRRCRPRTEVGRGSKFSFHFQDCRKAKRRQKVKVKRQKSGKPIYQKLVSAALLLLPFYFGL